MTPEFIVVALALLGALKLRYDDKAAQRRHDAAQANADRKHGIAVAQAKGGES